MGKTLDLMARKDRESIELLAPDPFLDRLRAWEAWVEKHLKIIVLAFAAILAAVLVTELVRGQSTRDSASVTAELGDAVKLYEEATEPSKVLTTTTAGALEAEYQKARDKFAAVSSAHPSHGAGRLAKLYEADLARRLGKHAEAQALFDGYVAGSDKDDSLLFLALEGAGYAAEAQGKLDEAVDRFSKIGEGSTAFYKDYGLKHKARVLEKKGDKAGAIGALQAIVAIEPPSSLRSAAEERLKSLQ